MLTYRGIPTDDPVKLAGGGGQVGEQRDQRQDSLREHRRWKRSGAKDVIDQVIPEEMVVDMVVQRGAEGISGNQVRMLSYKYLCCSPPPPNGDSDDSSGQPSGQSRRRRFDHSYTTMYARNACSMPAKWTGRDKMK
jgi:hypothetical protein